MSDWRTVLEPTPDCVDLARLGEELTAEERAHVSACVRCQTELALFDGMMAEERSPESEWIAAELERRNARGNVVAFRPQARRAWYAVAAALVLILGAGTWMQFREQPVDLDAPGTYRSVRLENLTPSGELAQAPNELRWAAVPGATHYRVRIVEVDAQPVWSSETTEPRAVLPPHVVAQFAPGKSLLWSVEAFRGNESLTESQTETVRVTP